MNTDFWKRLVCALLGFMPLDQNLVYLPSLMDPDPVVEEALVTFRNKKRRPSRNAVPRKGSKRRVPKGFLSETAA
jgi:hypothetical protein